MMEDNKQGFLTNFLVRIRSDKPILPFFRQEISIENLPEEQKRLGKKFREGVASGLGIPADNLSESELMCWILDFARSFMKPDHYDDSIAPTEYEIKSFGEKLGQMIRIAIEKIDDEPDMEDITKKSDDLIKEEIKEEKKDSVSISVDL